ncbi:hypothetical protein ACVIWU_000962 [Bradyrhizobium sp. USDA 4509]
MPTPKQMEKLTAEADRRRAPPAAGPDAPLPAEYWESVLKDPRAGATVAQAGSDAFRKSRPTCCASPAAGASGPWKSRPPMPSACMAPTLSGGTSRSGCSTTPASSAPAGMKKTGAGPRSRHRSRSGFADPISLRLDVRMAPKYYPTPLSGGDRKALTKELGKARAMASILATQSAEMRAKGEAMIQQADRLLCESWNERMWSDGEPIDPSPTIDQAVNGGFPWLEIRCARCKTPSDVDLAAMKFPPTTFVHDLVDRISRGPPIRIKLDRTRVGSV